MNNEACDVPKLIHFFVFNPTLSKKEGDEENKILFYHPSKTDMNSQANIIGLCEAVIQFTKCFTKKPCESLHTQQTRYAFFEAAENFWMALVVSIPRVKKIVNGVEVFEYSEEDVQDEVCHAVLQQSYETFKLFNGPIEHVLTKTDVTGLKERMDYFFSRYIYTISMDHNDVSDLFNGVQFMPLDKTTFLKVQCLVNQVEANFTMVRHTVFLYNDYLVWCALEADDTRVVYRYLTATLFPNHPELDTGTVSTKAGHMGRYIAGPPDLNKPDCTGNTPRLFLRPRPDQPPQEFILVAYRALRATICLFMDAAQPIPFDFYRTFDQVVGGELTRLADLICKSTSQQASGNNNFPAAISSSTDSPNFRYLYWNPMNLAVKSTLHPDGVPLRRSGMTCPVPGPAAPFTLRCIADLKYELDHHMDGDHGEVMVKLDSEAWLLAKRSNSREVYIGITQRNANLMEVHEEAKRLCNSQFSNILFVD